MNCPTCNHHNTRVTDTVRVADGIRRYRTCRKCAHRFATLERIETWDNSTGMYVPTEIPVAPAALAVVPDPIPRPKAAARFMPEPEDQALDNVVLEAQPLLLQWWNESRKSKHKGNATWTVAAWEASVRRVAALPADQQMLLAQAGVEHGWQTLKRDYIKDELARPTATGRPMPKDPAMRAALDQWPSQTA